MSATKLSVLVLLKMFKILFNLIPIATLLVSLLVNPPAIQAGTDRCDITVEGNRTSTSNIFVTIDDRRSDSSSDKVFNGRIFVYGPGVASGGTDQSQGVQFQMQNGSYRFGPVRLQAGDVTVQAKFIAGETSLLCSGNPTQFSVSPVGSTQPSCLIRDLGKVSGTTNTHNIVFSATDLSTTQSYTSTIDWQGHRELLNERFSLDGGSSGFWSSGVVSVDLTPPPSSQLDVIRGLIINTVTRGTVCTPPILTVASEATVSPPSPPGGGGTSGLGPTSTCANGTPGVQTDLGCFPSDPAGLANKIFGIVLGLAGALAILFIIIGGFKVAMSQGDPDALDDGRQMITQAILGLVFILLATTILGIIGIDILGLGRFFQRGQGGNIIVNP